MHRRISRLAAVASLCLMLVASLGGPALACATAMRPLPALTTPDAAPGHDQHHATPPAAAGQHPGDERDDSSGRDHAPCEPSAFDCCTAVTPCAVVLDIGASVSAPTPIGAVAPVASPTAAEPASPVTSPDPPPPKA